MSARPFTMNETGPIGFWPLAAASGGTVVASVRHMIDLAHFFPLGESRWPDALTAETRRHLGGCLATIEIALTVAARATPVGGALSALDMPLVWRAVQHQPHMLSPELMAHMRLRAAVALLARQAMRSAGDPAAAATEGSAWLLDDGDPHIVETAAALALAEARWTAQGGEDMPLRADLPAEYFTELIWTAAATMGTALHRAGLSEAPAAMTAMTDAAQAVLARHEEEQGAFARAEMLARLLRGRDEQARLLGQAIGERRYLLFAALAGDLIGVGMDAVLDTLVHGTDRQVAVLCHTLGGAPSDFRHILVDLGPVRGARDDSAMIVLSNAYDAMTAEEISAEMEALRCPAALRAKLALIAPVAGA